MAAKQDQDEWLTSVEAAEYLRKPVKTLESWRYRKTGPTYTRGVRAVLYRKSWLDEWLYSQAVKAVA